MTTPILEDIQTQLDFYGYPILIIFGVIGNIFIFILFNRRRYNACSIYLVSSAVANIFDLTVGGSLQINSSSYEDGSLRSLILCKLSNYIPAFLGQVTKTLLIFACVDRYLITSQSATLRAITTLKRAKYCTVGIYVFWAIGASHTLIWLTISHNQCMMVGFYVTFTAIYSLLFIGLIPSMILCMFGYLTFQNIRQLHNRIQPTPQDAHNINNAVKRRDRDLLVLVLAEVIAFIITTTPITLVFLESMITQFLFPSKSLALVQAEVFALNGALLIICGFSALPFYIYMIVSAPFRQDFKQLMVSIYRKIIQRFAPSQNNNRVVPIITQRSTAT